MEYLDPHDIWTPGPNIPDPFEIIYLPLKLSLCVKAHIKLITVYM